MSGNVQQLRSSLLSAVNTEGAFAGVEEIIEELRNGRMVVIVDAPDRENEGDIIIPAQMATPDAINFMAKHGRGLICLTITQARAAELQLDFMVRRNASRNRTAFTQSIEAREGISTGISARDRRIPSRWQPIRRRAQAILSHRAMCFR